MIKLKFTNGAGEAEAFVLTDGQDATVTPMKEHNALSVSAPNNRRDFCEEVRLVVTGESVARLLMTNFAVADEEDDVMNIAVDAEQTVTIDLTNDGDLVCSIRTGDQLNFTSGCDMVVFQAPE